MTPEQTIDYLKGGNRISWGDKYNPAMAITNKEDADLYLAACIQHNLILSPGLSQAKAAEIERCNIGYWAGYYDQATRLRVEELFDCKHPILGKAKDREWTPEEILKAGIDYGRKSYDDHHVEEAQ